MVLIEETQAFPKVLLKPQGRTEEVEGVLSVHGYHPHRRKFLWVLLLLAFTIAITQGLSQNRESQVLLGERMRGYSSVVRQDLTEKELPPQLPGNYPFAKSGIVLTNFEAKSQSGRTQGVRTFFVDEKVASVVAAFRIFLEQHGWLVVTSGERNSTHVLGARKDTTALSVAVRPNADSRASIVELSGSAWAGLSANGPDAGAVDVNISCSNTAVYNSVGLVSGWEIIMSGTASESNAPVLLSTTFGEATGLGSATLQAFVPEAFLNAYYGSVETIISESVPWTGSTARCLGGEGAVPVLEKFAQAGSTAVCPPATTHVVVAGSTSVKVGQQAEVFVPNGWKNGQILVADDRVAEVLPGHGGSASFIGKHVGATTIYGSGWTAPSGAQNCFLGAAVTTVTAQPVGTFSLDKNLISACGQGHTAITVAANVYSNVLVYGANGLADGTQLLRAQANFPKTFMTGGWLREGTRLRLVAPFDGDAALSEVALRLDRSACGQNYQKPSAQPPPPAPSDTIAPASDPGYSALPPPSGSSVPASDALPAPSFASVYNSQTAPAEFGPLPCGRLLAVWSESPDPGSIDGFHIYNNTLKIFTPIDSPSTTRFEFAPSNPTASYNYSVVSFKGSMESIPTRAGSIAATWPCAADISASNLDIISVRGVEISSDPARGGDANLLEVLPIADADLIGFAVNIINNGHRELPGAITVTSELVGLTEPAREGFAPRLVCYNRCRLKSASFDAALKRLTFVIEPVASGLAPSEIWQLVYTAQTQAPTSVPANTFRFQNQININGATSALLKTPSITVYLDAAVPGLVDVQ